ncbi:MAG TPA: TonB-dependent receptor plug domain-containing protein, partial [Puia sp.]|nr:TonB-dependent receptor plug domain-containing protein [Puia sp.]
MIRFFGLLLVIWSEPLLAQHSVTLHFYNEDSRQPLAGVTILLLPEKIHRLSDSAGTATITGLAAGRHSLTVTSTGFRGRSLAVFLLAPDTSLDIALDPLVETMQDVVVSSTRSNRLLKNTPVTVQIVDREDIQEGTAESPANIRELLTELSGTQVQQTSATSGNVNIRLQGLDGRYTQLLKDGFPMYGGFSGSLSILQVPPLDLRQVEVIKGAGSALYGGDAIAGIINLISRTPDTMPHLDAIVNQTDRGETDLGGY